MRVGIGYDVHPLVEGRQLFLGGIEIPYNKGLLGHSDGDVLIHAICDAMLGALSEGDIGIHFPDTDESIKGIKSEKILSHVKELIKKRGFSIVNIDAVIALEEPKIQPHRTIIRENLARVLDLDIERVNLKGKTTEKLGFVGQKKGIEVFAVALLEKQ